MNTPDRASSAMALGMHQKPETISTMVQITWGVFPRARKPGTSHRMRMAYLNTLDCFPLGNK